MAFVTREDIAAAKLPYKDVPVPELGDGKEIRVRAITRPEKVRFVARLWTKDANGKPVFTPEGYSTRWLLLACCNEDFSPMFTEADAPFLDALDSKVYDRLIEAAEHVSGEDLSGPEIREAFRQAQTSVSRTS